MTNLNEVEQGIKQFVEKKQQELEKIRLELIDSYKRAMHLVKEIQDALGGQENG